MIGVAVLGSTGSIGDSTLDVLRQHPDRFRVVALAAQRNISRLAEQCVQFRPEVVALADASLVGALRQRLQQSQLKAEILTGPTAAEQVAVLPQVQVVMAAIVGAAGLASTLAAAGSGKRLLVANKEALVMAGPQVLAAALRSGATLIPIDSEHNAIFQCLPQPTQLGHAPPGVRRILLTASGGPFRDWSATDLQHVTPEQACAHPTWLMNKGLELIEAHLLFGMAPEQIEVVIHKQSVVHSLVEYVDGSVLAQLGSPDMRTPIAQALGWPQRLASGVQFLDLLRVARLDFAPPDPQRFPCLGLAMQAAQAGAELPAVLSAANEVAVAAFLAGRLNFAGIPRVIGEVMENWTSIGAMPDLDAVLEADAAARRFAEQQISHGAGARSARR
jgi:1-deoxy-D-xylulose-5-phosphate reductoisomerase